MKLILTRHARRADYTIGRLEDDTGRQAALESNRPGEVDETHRESKSNLFNNKQYLAT